MTTEEFRPIPGFPGYSVGDRGTVLSMKRGKLRVKVPSQRNGYTRYDLSVAGRTIKRGAHQLVALAFIGPRPAGQEVRHLDGVKSHNVLANLAYGTPAQNSQDTLRLGRNVQANKTHCKRGHEFTEENTAFVTGRPGHVARRCRKCDVIKQLAYQARIRATRGALA